MHFGQDFVARLFCFEVSGSNEEDDEERLQRTGKIRSLTSAWNNDDKDRRPELVHFLISWYVPFLFIHLCVSGFTGHVTRP